MTNPNWGLLDPNAFARGYQQSNAIVGGIADNYRQGQSDNAMRAYAMNPDDPNALTALAQHGDPRVVMQMRQQQQQAQAAKQERDTKIIATLARDAKDPQSFDAAVDQVVAMGYPEAVQFKGKFSPSLRSALMAAGGIKDETAAQPNIAKEVEYYRSIGRPELADRLLTNHASGPPIMVDNGDGTKTLYPREALAGGQQQGAEPLVSDQATYDAVPPGTTYKTPDGNVRVKPGGPTQPASGGFL